MIDRLVHHAEELSLTGDSYRLKDRDLGRVSAATKQAQRMAVDVRLDAVRPEDCRSDRFAYSRVGITIRACFGRRRLEVPPPLRDWFRRNLWGLSPNQRRQARVNAA